MFILLAVSNEVIIGSILGGLILFMIVAATIIITCIIIHKRHMKSTAIKQDTPNGV